MPISFLNAVPDCITLTKSQRQSFIHMADAIVAETLQANEHFVARGRKWPLEQWKYVKTKEQMHVYRSRDPQQTMTAFNIMNDEILPSRPRFLSLSAMERAPPGLPYVHEYEAVTPELYEKDSTNTHSTSSSNHSSFSRENNDVVAQSKPPFVVATGVLDGTVDDVAYGAMASTVHAWTVRSAYVQDTTLYDDRKVFATLQGPRAEDPFRSVTIKWAATSYGAWTTRRDFVCVESTGMAFNADGERVFYSLLHSIELEACAPVYERKVLIRAYISTCYLARQFDGLRVGPY